MKCVIILQKKGPWYDLITEPTDKQDTYVSITQLSGGVFFFGRGRGLMVQTIDELHSITKLGWFSLQMRRS